MSLVLNLPSNDAVRAALVCVAPDPVGPCEFRRARLGPLLDGTTRGVLEATFPTGAGSDDATERTLDLFTGINVLYDSRVSCTRIRDILYEDLGNNVELALNACFTFSTRF